MIAAGLLLTYALVAATIGKEALVRAQWPRRAPAWGIVAWQALSTSVAAAVLLAGLAVGLPVLPEPIARTVGIDATVLAAHYQTPVGAWPGLLTLAASFVVATAVAFYTVDALLSARRRRIGLERRLRTVGRTHPDGYIVLEHTTALVYCLPGRSRTIVVTRAAVEALSPTELDLVLAHERRHLHARHDLALAFAGALLRVFRLRLFVLARRQIGVLAEMSADDSARDAGDRRLLAGALVSLGGGPTVLQTVDRDHFGQHRSSLLDSTGDLDQVDPSTHAEAVERVRRLVSMTAPLGTTRGLLVGLAAVVVTIMPIGLTMAPALEAAASGCCETSAD